jgi:hypothetical protein
MNINRKILFIPIDDRPCTFRMPVRIGEIARCELVHPDVKLLGQALRPGEPDRILDWIQNTIENMDQSFDATIIATDMLLYGGLVASRKSEVFPEIITERFNRFFGILENNRDRFGRIYLQKTIMRAAPTYTDESVVPVIQKIIEFSCLCYKSENDHKSLSCEIDKLRREIPEDFLNSYLKARESGHEINRRLLMSMKDTNIDYLLFCLDDSKTTGLNIREKEELQNIADSENLSSRVSIIPGTDETACLLLARALSELTGCSPKIHTIYSQKSGQKVIPAYEDRTYEEIVNLHLGATNCRSVDSKEDADVLLYVHVPLKHQRESACQILNVLNSKTAVKSVTEIREELNKGRNVALADVFYANGADRSLMSQIVREINPLNLWSFAAWNTAGNSIGTVIAHSVVRFIGEKLISNSDEEQRLLESHLNLLLERFADDWLYQSIIRQQVSAEARLRRISVFHLDEWTEHFENLVGEKIKTAFMDFYKSSVQNNPVRGKVSGNLYNIVLKDLQVKLPWSRLFEADIETDISLVLSPVNGLFVENTK